MAIDYFRLRALGGLVAFVALLPSAPASAQAATAVPSLSVTSMVGGADSFVKGVMAILLVASVASWTILIAKWLQISKARRELMVDIEMLDSSTLSQAGRQARNPATRSMVSVAMREVERCGDLSPMAIEGVKERVSARLTVAESAAIQKMLVGISILGSIGATAPFVGLAGTVWGIMNSFIGIAKSHATNLAVVAPGIAEALLATAMGLVAAIPAVLIYNTLARAIARYRQQINEVAVLTACAVSREYDGQPDKMTGSVSPLRANA